MQILYELHSDRLVVEVTDDGEGFEPPSQPSDALDGHELTEGGLGIAIIEALADELEIRRARAGRFVPALRQAALDLLPLVNVGHKSLGDYATLVSRGLMNEIERLAEPLQGKRIAHVSATAFGGGVAEINYTLVPLMADAGLDVEWRIIHGEDEFFNVTKAIHNGLQGASRSLSAEEQAIFARFNAENAAQFSEADYDFVIIHDPQPVAMIDSFPDRARKVDLARAHRLLDAERGGVRRPAAVDPPLRRVDLPHARVRPARGSAACGRLAARDRSADAEEHGALARGRGVHRRPVRHRRRASAAHAGVAVRSVEGPARRDRRVPPGEAALPGGAARTRRLDGARRSRRAGTTTSAPPSTPTATTTSTSSAT